MHERQAPGSWLRAPGAAETKWGHRAPGGVPAGRIVTCLESGLEPGVFSDTGNQAPITACGRERRQAPFNVNGAGIRTHAQENRFTKGRIMGRGYEDLQVWKAGMDLAVRCYEVVRCFPPSERYILTSQLLRSAISIPSNIAEGRARGSDREYAHHLRIAAGSLAELETQLLLSVRIGYIETDAAGSILDDCRQVGRMLNGLVSFLTRTDHLIKDSEQANPEAHIADNWL
jgi:four helix bundle protein